LIIFAKPCSCILLLLLAGCGAFVPTPQPTPTLVPEEQDQSWLTDQPCQAPCWYGLEPGVSTMQQVVDTVSELSFIRLEDVYKSEIDVWSYYVNSSIPGSGLGYGCANPPNDPCVAFSFIDDQLHSIILTPNFSITLGEVIEQIGPPDLFAYARPNAEGKDCDLQVFWGERQLELRIRHVDRRLIGRGVCQAIREANGRVPSDLEIDWVFIIPQEDSDAISGSRAEDFGPWIGLIGGD